MKRLLTFSFLFLTLLLFAMPSMNRVDFAAAQPESAPLAQPNPVASQADVTQALQSAPIMFIQNVGQFDDDARFQVWGGTSTMWLAEDALWLTLLEAPDDNQLIEHGLVEKSSNEPRKGVNLKLSFVGANPQPEIEPFNLLETKMNYFLGNDPDKWRSNVPVYGGVRYKDIYPGIDLELTSEAGQTVQRFVAQGDADLDAVRLRVEGANEIELLTNRMSGEPMGLTVKTAIGDLTLPLFALVTPDGTPLDSTHASILNNNHILAPFAPTSEEPLTRVPDSTLAYSTFIGGLDGDGGAGTEGGSSLALDSAGNVIVTGSTTSSEFPMIAGSYDTSYNGDYDTFVLKLGSKGDELIYSTFIGGYDDDISHEIALDSAGEAVVTGYTDSDDFPTTAGSYDTSQSYRDAFVFKLNAAGNALIYSTFLGNDYSIGLGVALDNTGNAIVIGETSDDEFPTTQGSYDTSYNGGGDGFVLKLTSKGDDLIYSTFIGGSSDDESHSLALDSAGNVVVTGITKSNDFPTTTGAYDTTHNRSFDIFVLKLSSVGNDLLYSTFIGGSDNDYANSLALDSAGNAFVTGSTNSDNFPTVLGSYDVSHNLSSDVFVFKLNATGDSLEYSTFIGSSSYEYGNALALDSAGNAIVMGYTNALNSRPFPTTLGSYDTSHNGDRDTFILKLNAAGDSLLYSTLIGGSKNDHGWSLALDSADNAIITGETRSRDFPTTAGSYDTTYNHDSNDPFGDDYDVFVLRLDRLEQAKLLFLPLITRSGSDSSGP